MTSKDLDFAKPLFSILFVIAVWQAAHTFGLANRNLFPGPWEVATASVKLFNDGVMMKDLKTSVSRAVVGFSIGASLGILAGILTARVALVRLALYPFFNINSALSQNLMSSSLYSSSALSPKKKPVVSPSPPLRVLF